MDMSIQRNTPYTTQFLFIGNLYQLTSVQSIGSSATVDFQVKTDANILFHTLGRNHAFDGGGPFTVQLIENPTLTNGTIPVIAANLNRNSARTHATQAFANPTGVSGGTVIETLFIPSQGSGSNTFGNSYDGVERVLKKNTNYILRTINAGAASTFYTQVLFYESSN